jgi:bifunctional NMN adenylyltransferase/nudix hydrolase
MTIDPENYTIGVIVARFQVDDMHEGHNYIVEQVISNHGKTIIFLGVPPFVGTYENPLDFDTRKKMVQEAYPDTVIMSIPDQPTNERWAAELDNRVREVFPETQGEVLMYGSRDSFIKHYQNGGGRFDTTELKQLGTFTGTDIRKKISEKTKASKDFRYGCIYTAYNQFPRVIPAVHIIPITDGKVLLVKKYNETKYRFPGALIRQQFDSYEVAAKSVLSDKVGSLETERPFKSLFTSGVRDWRVRGRDSVMTNVFEANILFGMPTPHRDYEEVRAFDIKDLRKEIMIDEHQPLLEQYLKIKN